MESLDFICAMLRKLSCLFAYTSTARVTTFFPSLASTNPTLSELGRSFKPVLLRAILIAQRTALRRVR